jgi:integrase
LKVGDVNLDQKYISVSSDIAKTHKERFSALTPDLIDSLKKLNLDQYPKNYYLFGYKLKPSAERAGNGYYRKQWAKIREKLNLPKEMQFYSFRDTGIFEMLKSGIDDLSVMQHANHSSLNITTIYADHYDENLIETISNNVPDF